jgi:SAM-dependent methyltransferase
LRNRPALALIRRLLDQYPSGATLRLVCLACSNGAEVYSIVSTIRSTRPDLVVIPHAVDISRPVVEAARQGVYSLTDRDLGNIFARVRPDELSALFDADEDGATVRIKAWIKHGIHWHVADAESPDLRDALGPQHMVFANNFLCHMTSAAAERCLRNIARLVAPGGYLFVSGVDLDLRTRVATELGWQPVDELLEAIHDGDPVVRNDWPWHYWGLEPLNRRRPDWRVRYASVFRFPAGATATAAGASLPARRNGSRGERHTV